VGDFHALQVTHGRVHGYDATGDRFMATGDRRHWQVRSKLGLTASPSETWVCSYLSLALLAGVGLYALFGWWWADPVGALAMLPVILWQGWETLGEAREHEDQENAGPHL
jgi:hypothetical protein